MLGCLFGLPSKLQQNTQLGRKNFLCGLGRYPPWQCGCETYQLMVWLTFGYCMVRMKKKKTQRNCSVEICGYNCCCFFCFCFHSLAHGLVSAFCFECMYHVGALKKASIFRASGKKQNHAERKRKKKVPKHRVLKLGSVLK